MRERFIEFGETVIRLDHISMLQAPRRVFPLGATGEIWRVEINVFTAYIQADFVEFDQAQEAYNKIKESLYK